MPPTELHVGLSDKVRAAISGSAAFTEWSSARSATQRTLLDEDGNVNATVKPPTTVPLSLVRAVVGTNGIHAALHGECIRPVTVPTADPSKKEHRQRMRRLKDQLEQRAYDTMVGNVHQERNDATRDLTMGAMLNETGMVLDMRIMTLGVAVAGYLLPMFVGWSDQLCWLGAAIGAVGSLFVEATLSIIRINKYDRQEAKRKLKLEKEKGYR